MEGTNGIYEPMNGSPGGSRGTFGSGNCSEGLVEPQMCDDDCRDSSASKGMEAVIISLDDVDKICTAMIKRVTTPDGLGNSLAAVSHHSTEITGTKNSPLATGADKFLENKREKFVPPVGPQDVIDHPRFNTVTSRRPDREAPEDAGQVLSSPLAMGVAFGVVELSDDYNKDDVHEKVISWPSHAVSAATEAKVDDNVSPEVKVDGSGDPLHHVWESMTQIMDLERKRENGGHFKVTRNKKKKTRREV